MNKIQSEKDFKKLCDQCCKIEPKFSEVIKAFGYPPFWHREPTFATLLLTILEQQVSLASAKATFTKLLERVELITPANVLNLSTDEFRTLGFSRQKTSYVKTLAVEIASNRLNLEELNTWPEEKIRSRLIRLNGIGHWTVDMYLLMSLHFSDIFPPGDLATIKAVYELKLASPETTTKGIIQYMQKFSPNRSVATYILWHSYIEKRNLILE